MQVKAEFLFVNQMGSYNIISVRIMKALKLHVSIGTWESWSVRILVEKLKLRGVIEGRRIGDTMRAQVNRDKLRVHYERLYH